MLSNDLRVLRDVAHAALLDADRPVTPETISRRLFGAGRHEDPVAAVVLRHLLQGDPRFQRTPAGRWAAADAPYLALPLTEATFVVVDLETTGSVLGVDQVMEIGVVVVRRGQVVERFASLVRADRPVPLWVRRLTGIRTADLATAPAFPDLAPRLGDLLGQGLFAAHDLRFDLPFLRWEFARHGLVMPEVVGFCTLQLARLFFPELASKRLADLALHFGVAHAQPHRARDDAAAAAEVLLRVLERARQLGLGELGDLLRGPPAPAAPRRDLARATLAAEATG